MLVTETAIDAGELGHRRERSASEPRLKPWNHASCAKESNRAGAVVEYGFGRQFQKSRRGFQGLLGRAAHQHVAQRDDAETRGQTNNLLQAF